MKISKRQVDGITVVTLDGRLDSSASGQVMDELCGFVNAGSIMLILNLLNRPGIAGGSNS